jgi:hypothetical protein
LDKINDEGGGGAPPVESKVEPPPAANTPPPKEGGKEFDDLGYEKPAPPKDEKPPDEKTKEPIVDKKVEVKATGYAEPPPKIEEPPPAPKVETPPVLDEIDEMVKELPKEEAAKMKEFAKTHSVPKEILKAFAELRKTEIKNAETYQANAEKEALLQEQRNRAAWHKELKDDPAFGGEKFDKNVSQTEKVLEEFLPQTKKMLTERKGILPPYLMRDLAKLADHLYATEKLVQGEPKVETEEKTKEDDPLAFYT